MATQTDGYKIFTPVSGHIVSVMDINMIPVTHQVLPGLNIANPYIITMDNGITSGTGYKNNQVSTGNYQFWS